MAEYGQVYGNLRGRVIDLVGGLDDGALGASAPATPEWRVRDVVAHLAGIPADILAGNLDGVATDAWTARQVAARRDRPFAEVLGEWKETGTKVDGMFADFPDLAARQMLADAATHEHDIRGALGAPGARDDDAVAIGFAFLTMGVAEPLRFETEAARSRLPRAVMPSRRSGRRASSSSAR